MYISNDIAERIKDYATIKKIAFRKLLYCSLASSPCL